LRRLLGGGPMTSRSLLVLLALQFAGGLVPGEARATWSIVAVDPETREVGAAAATCTVGVELIHGSVPGKGVILAQAATNIAARRRGVEMIASGASPKEVIDVIATEEFNPGRPWNAPWREQQYGVVVLGADPSAVQFTGADTVPWSGGQAEGSVSVQGNMLYGPEVVDAAFRTFREAEGSPICRRNLAERLLLALEAGAERGGDKRCSRGRGALTAFLAVSRPDDPADSPSLYLVAPRAFGLLGSLRHMLFSYSPSGETPPPVRQLRDMYESWLETHPGWRDSCSEDETEGRDESKRQESR